MNDYKNKQVIHTPVLLDKVIEALDLDRFARLKSQAKLIDATVGAGGHSVEIVRKGGIVLGIDADCEMLAFAKKRLEKACPPRLLQKAGSFKLVHGNFRNIDKIALENGFSNVDGVLIDLGVSTYQLTSQKRGFSFQYPDAILDMRVDKTTSKVTAADLLNGLPKNRLFELFNCVCSFNESKRLSKAVVKQRQSRPYTTVGDFLNTVRETIKPQRRNIHPATLAFMALRIAVNSELENLKEALPKAFGLLKSKGKLVVISFHSSEDSFVKSFFKEIENKDRGRVITKKPVRAGGDEIKKNPKARSAKMRVLEKNKNEKKNKNY